MIVFTLFVFAVFLKFVALAPFRGMKECEFWATLCGRVVYSVGWRCCYI